VDDARSSALVSVDLQGKVQVRLDGRMLAFTERIQENSAAMIEH